ncbi:MAG TPA: hypothetical protein VLA20_11960 [Vicinamibacterales bacterium]|nr:hypothetical protein [Vicinamibacterales bacterium]
MTATERIPGVPDALTAEPRRLGRSFEIGDRDVGVSALLDLERQTPAIGRDGIGRELDVWHVQNFFGLPAQVHSPAPDAPAAGRLRGLAR